MENKFEVVFEGVTYSIPQSEYDAIKAKIQSRTWVMTGKNENAINRAPAKPATPTSAISREPVTTTTLQRVMGVHYTECAIYDCENNKLLTQIYNGVDVDWDNNDTNNAKSFKEWFDKEFKKENLTLVCSVSKQVSEISYPGWGKWTRDGQEIRMNSRGCYTVCNFIVRDETTGKLQMLNDAAWLGVRLHAYPNYAARWGACNVANCGAGNSDFQSAVRAVYQRNKVASK